MAKQIKVAGKTPSGTAFCIVKAYVQQNPNTTWNDLCKAFPNSFAPNDVTDMFVSASSASSSNGYFTNEESLIKLQDGSIVSMAKNWTDESLRKLANFVANYNIVVEMNGQLLVSGNGATKDLQKVNTPALGGIDQHAIIQTAVSINYSSVEKYATVASHFVKPLKTFLPAIVVLRDAAENYKVSTSSDKDTEYIDFLLEHLDAKFLLDTLSPIANSIPGGGIIINILEMLVKEPS